MRYEELKQIFSSTNIENAIQKFDVDLIIIFGSVAKGTANSYSDIDIAVLTKNLNSDTITRTRYGLIDFFEALFKQGCDVIILNEAPPELKYQVVKYGKVLFEKDKAFNSFFSKTLSEYFDFKYFIDKYYTKVKESFLRGDVLGRP